jgi:hypothetical protein
MSRVVLVVAWITAGMLGAMMELATHAVDIPTCDARRWRGHQAFYVGMAVPMGPMGLAVALVVTGAGQDGLRWRRPLCAWEAP